MRGRGEAWRGEQDCARRGRGMVRRARRVAERIQYSRVQTYSRVESSELLARKYL